MAEGDRLLTVLLQIRSDISDLAKTKAGISEVKAEAESAGKSAFTLADALRFAGVDVSLHGVLDIVREIAVTIGEGVKTGIEFQAEMQQVQTGIAGLLRQEAPNYFTDFAKASAFAGEAVDLLKQKANELGISYQDLFEAFQHAQAQMVAGGIPVNDIQKQIDLIVILNRAMQSLGVSSTNASRDIGDILQGQASRTLGGGRLAAALGMSKEELDQWIISLQQSGTLFEGFMSRLIAMQEAGRAASQNFNNDLQRLKNALLDLEAEAAKPLMQPLTESLVAANGEMISSAPLAYARTIGELGATAVRVAGQIGQLIGQLAQFAAGFKSVADFQQQHPIVSFFASPALSSLVAFGRNVAENQETIQLEQFQKRFQLLDQQARAAELVADKEKVTAEIGGLIAELQNKITSGATKHAQEWTEILKAVRDYRNHLSDSFGTGEKIIAQRHQEKSAVEAMAKTEAERKLLQAQAAGDQDAIAAERGAVAYETRLKALLAAKVPQADAEKEARLYADDVEAAARHAQGLKDAKAGERDIQRDLTTLMREEAALLERARFKEQVIQQNPFLSVDQKQSLLFQNYTEQINLLNAAIAQQKQFIAHTALDPAQLAQAQGEMQKMVQQVALLSLRMQTLTFGGSFRASLVAWVNQFGDAGKQAASVLTNTLNTAIGSTSQALTGLIFGTKNWQQAFVQAAQSIVQNLIQIALQYVVSKLVMAAIDRATGNTTGQAATQAAGQAAAAWAPAAISASIASYGSAAYTGLFAYGAALAAGEVLAVGASAAGGAIGGAAEGGRIPGSPSTRDNLLMPMATGEHVISAAATTWADRNLGPDFLDSLNNMRVAVPRGMAEGGRVGSISTISNYNTTDSPSRSSDVHIYNFVDRDELAKHVLNTSGGRKILIDFFRSKKLDLGFA
jgi:hypothetical protein